MYNGPPLITSSELLVLLRRDPRLGSTDAWLRPCNARGLWSVQARYGCGTANLVAVPWVRFVAMVLAMPSALRCVVLQWGGAEGCDVWVTSRGR